MTYCPRIKPLIVFHTLILALVGCAAPEQNNAQDDTSSNAVSQHVIHSAELQRTMRSLYFDIHTEEENVEEFNEFRSKHAFELINALEKMAIEIRTMDSVDTDKREIFKVYATRMRSHANEIRDIVAELRLDELNGAVDRVVESCDACHKQIRN